MEGAPNSKTRPSKLSSSVSPKSYLVRGHTLTQRCSVNYVPPYTEKEDTPGWFRAFRAAMTPRNSTVGAWGFRTRLKEAMGQVMAHKTEECVLPSELPSRSYDRRADDQRIADNRSSRSCSRPTPTIPGSSRIRCRSPRLRRSLNRRPNHGRRCTKALQGEGCPITTRPLEADPRSRSGDLQSERCRQLLHPDLIADLEAKRKRLIDALGGAPSGPSASTSDISLSWRVHHESASPIVKGTLVTAKRRPYDEERALSQALVRWRTWQSLEIRNTKTGQLIMGNHEDPKFIMEVRRLLHFQHWWLLMTCLAVLGLFEKRLGYPAAMEDVPAGPRRPKAGLARHVIPLQRSPHHTVSAPCMLEASSGIEGHSQHDCRRRDELKMSVTAARTVAGQPDAPQRAPQFRHAPDPRLVSVGFSTSVSAFAGPQVQPAYRYPTSALWSEPAANPGRRLGAPADRGDSVPRALGFPSQTSSLVSGPLSVFGHLLPHVCDPLSTVGQPRGRPQ